MQIKAQKTHPEMRFFINGPWTNYQLVAQQLIILIILIFRPQPFTATSSMNNSRKASLCLPAVRWICLMFCGDIGGE